MKVHKVKSHKVNKVNVIASASTFDLIVFRLDRLVSGFSLIELLIYMAILSGLMVIITNTFISISKGGGQSGARSEVNSAIRFSTERIKQDVKNATSTTAIITPILGVSSSTLKITSSDGTPITYSVSAGQLLRNDNGVISTTTGPNIFVSVPLFTRLENYNSVVNATTTSLQVDMTFQYNSSSTDWRYSDRLRTMVMMR